MVVLSGLQTPNVLALQGCYEGFVPRLWAVKEGEVRKPVECLFRDGIGLLRRLSSCCEAWRGVVVVAVCRYRGRIGFQIVIRRFEHDSHPRL